MKELILWKEVDVKDATAENAFKDISIVEFQTFEGGVEELKWLKRVVIPILSDHEIIDLSNEVVPSFFDKDLWRTGYKYKQDQIIEANEK